MIKFKKAILLTYLKIKKKILIYQTNKIKKDYNVNDDDLENCDLELWDDLEKIVKLEDHEK